jgi:myo-inositol-1(or 4)-monophosphatase
LADTREGLFDRLPGKSYTAAAVSIAAKAGEWIRSKAGQHETLEIKANASDLVTEVDKGSEAMIRNLVKTYFPEHGVLGEEGLYAEGATIGEALEAAWAGGREYVWIVDPLDGTTNFVHGFPFYVVSLALAWRGEVVAGVVYDPNRDEMFVAEKGKGAYFRGRRMRVSGEGALADSLLATGFPASRGEMLRDNVAGIGALAPLVRNIRAAGSAALHMAYVACGRLTGFWELNLNPWDLAAGALLVQEAGGKVTDTLGRPYSLETRHVIATNGSVHEELRKVLAEAGATGMR